MDPSPVVELHAGALRLALRPDLGGCIAGFWHGALPVLDSHDPTALQASRPSGCFPLVPYSNRLAWRRFEWAGQGFTTAANFDGSPHSLHGVAWRRAWQVVSQEATRAELRCEHRADADWPFDFEVRQSFELTPQALTVRLVLRNTDARAQPAGLGWHPYFPKRARSRVQLDVAARWEVDEAQLPTHAVPQPGLEGEVAQLALDHCFEGWRGEAVLRDEALALRLRSDLGHVVVFTPSTRPYYCVEPVSHLNDAIHRAEPAAHGLRTLAPGESMSGFITLEVAPA